MPKQCEKNSIQFGVFNLLTINTPQCHLHRFVIANSRFFLFCFFLFFVNESGNDFLLCLFAAKENRFYPRGEGRQTLLILLNLTVFLDCWMRAQEKLFNAFVTSAAGHKNRTAMKREKIQQKQQQFIVSIASRAIYWFIQLCNDFHLIIGRNIWYRECIFRAHGFVFHALPHTNIFGANKLMGIESLKRKIACICSKMGNFWNANAWKKISQSSGEMKNCWNYQLDVIWITKNFGENFPPQNFNNLQLRLICYLIRFYQPIFRLDNVYLCLAIKFRSE